MHAEIGRKVKYEKRSTCLIIASCENVLLQDILRPQVECWIMIPLREEVSQGRFGLDVYYRPRFVPQLCKVVVSVCDLSRTASSGGGGGGGSVRCRR